MKKFLSVVVAVGTLFTTSVYAAQGVTFSSDSDTDIVTLKINNESFTDKQLAFYLFKPGKSADDLKADSSVKDVIYQTLVFDFNKNNDSVKVKMQSLNTENHLYKYLFISQTGEKIEGEYEYYTKSEKDAFLSEINAAKNVSVPQNLAERIQKYFNLQDFSLYNAVQDKEKIGALVMEQVKDTDASRDNIAKLFENACVTAAFCEGTSGLLQDNEFLYMDYINPDAKYLNYYNENLSDEGKVNCIGKIINPGYKNLSEIKNNMEKHIILNALNHNKLMGYGHISTVINDFSAELSALGLDVASYSAGDKNLIGSRYVALTEQPTLEAAISALNEIIKDSGSQSGGGTSGGGSSGGASGGSSGGRKNNSGGVITPSTIPSDDVKKPAEEAVFGDLENCKWAEESIVNLFKKGIISGREPGMFAPGDNITREEFAVILCKAFDFNNAGNTINFNDVLPDRWSYEYIMKSQAANVISGDENGNFHPDEDIKRQDIAAILLRVLINKNIISDIKPSSGVFSDENEISKYASEGVGIMNALKIISGDGNGAFRPKSNATRAETAVIIQRVLELM